ncbi:RHS repeat-associated core domain-containing protein, partial [Chryseobacterium sp. CBo1]|uniref:RHS repeat-associated core domain-containing protein n=1 Tax=Chryseobacterium sp. CBo1 TaxID=1869230 RepID=UPI000A97C104
PTAINHVLSVNYYDTYPLGTPGFTPTLPGNAAITDNFTQNVNTKSLPLASYVKNIEDDNWTKNYTWYDNKGRAIATHSINHLGGYTKTESQLDFSGTPKQVVTRHKRLDTDVERLITENFTYDHQNRLLEHTHQVDGNAVEYLAQNEYNELSQLKSKKVGGTSAGNGLQTVDYAYNIRGWMTGINDPNDLSGGDLFGYKIKYNNPVYSGIASGRFNGNIAEIDWKTSAANSLKRYTYSYDGLNRLKDAVYTDPEQTNPYSNNYNEHLTYDLNGNIKTLKRFAFPGIGAPTALMVDDLDYQYAGNRLTQIIESALNHTGYEGGNNLISYDDNGNMINMKDKNIQSIFYNHLNLPNYFSIPQIDWSGLLVPVTLSYLYRADGTKLRKTYSTGGGRGQSTSSSITDYLDGFHYNYNETIAPCEWCRSEVAFEEQAYQQRDIILDPSGGFPPPINPTWVLSFVATSEGFYSFTENRYIYQYADHLGNSRISYAKKADGSLEITDKNDYYPFGLNHIGGAKSLLGGYQNYKYNGKELQETGMYDYGARFYMPDIGRWGVVDPLAEQSRAWSPYRYAYNNPLRFIDPDGRSESDWVQRGSQVFFDDKVKSQADAVATYGETAQHLGEGSTLTTKVNGEVTSQYTFHNNGTVSSDLGPLDNRFDHTTQGGTTIMASNSTGGYGALNYGNVATGAALEQGSGIARVGSNYKLYTATQTGRVFHGNQHVKTYSISKFGTKLGYVAAGAGLVMDGIGVYNYTQNPNAPDAVTPTKAATNTGMSAWGILGGPYGVMVSAAYGGMEAIYPGGVEGAMNDNTKFQSELDNGVNKAGPNRVYIIPRGPK